MSNVDIFTLPPEVQKVNRFPKNCADTPNTLRPGKNARQRRVHSNKADVDIRITLPQPHKEVGLHCLSTDVTQARCYDPDPKPP